MPEDFDDAIEVDVLANALRMGKAESKDLLETLAIRLEAIMPDVTTIERGGWILSSARPVKAVTVRFDHCHLQLVKERTGTLTASILKVVRGVVLKTSVTTLDDWFKTLATEMTKAAHSNTQTREALKNFVIG